MKKQITLTMVLSLLICPGFGQYLTDFQAVYPFSKGLNSTKNYTFTKEKSLISPTIPGYMIMASSSVASSSIALAALKLDANFTVSFTRSFLPNSITNSVSLVTNDVLATLKGGYIACGRVMYNQTAYAFIAEFDAKATPLWYKEYPGIVSLNAIIEIPSSSVTGLSYVACGTYNIGANYATGIILGIDTNGVPIWQNNTASNSKSDKFEYNDIISLASTADTAAKQIAIVGNAITQPYADKNVILTVLDLKGNMQYSYLYGLKNDGSTVYDEEGYGLALSIKNQIIITGRTKCYYVLLPAIRWDDVLLFAVDLNGTPNWSYRYDIPKNSANGEYGQKVLLCKESLYVSGYYKSYAFTNNGSYDAFWFETTLNGIPSPVRVYGDVGDDLFYAQEINHAQDGIISAGFSSSFVQSPSTASTYAPYVVESYKQIEKPCSSLIFNLPYEKAKLDMGKIDSYLSTAKYVDKKLFEIKDPVEEKVVCPKIPWLTMPIVESQTKTEGLALATEQSNAANTAIKLKTNPVQNALIIEGAAINSIYTIYTGNGKIVAQGTLNSTDIDVAKLTHGMYFISVNSGPKTVTLKFVKE